MTIDDPHRPRKGKRRHRHGDSKAAGHHDEESQTDQNCDEKRRGKKRRHKKLRDKKLRDKKSRRKSRGGSSTIPRFCGRHLIGRSTYYDLRKRGLGPEEMHIGRLVRISYRAECDWIKQMEAPEAAVVPPLADLKAESSEEGDASKAIEASDETDEQNKESEASDETRMPKHRAKRKKTSVRQHPKRAERIDEVAASAHGSRRNGKRKKHHRHHPDE